MLNRAGMEVRPLAGFFVYPKNTNVRARLHDGVSRGACGTFPPAERFCLLGRGMPWQNAGVGARFAQQGELAPQGSSAGYFVWARAPRASLQLAAPSARCNRGGAFFIPLSPGAEMRMTIDLPYRELIGIHALLLDDAERLLASTAFCRAHDCGLGEGTHAMGQRLADNALVIAKAMAGDDSFVCSPFV